MKKNKPTFSLYCHYSHLKKYYSHLKKYYSQSKKYLLLSVAVFPLAGGGTPGHSIAVERQTNPGFSFVNFWLFSQSNQSWSKSYWNQFLFEPSKMMILCLCYGYEADDGKVNGTYGVIGVIWRWVAKTFWSCDIYFCHDLEQWRGTDIAQGDWTLLCHTPFTITNKTYLLKQASESTLLSAKQCSRLWKVWIKYLATIWSTYWPNPI